MDGGCLCGAVRYTITEQPAPADSGTCHCETCRRTASAPQLPFVGVRASGFRYTRGSPVDYASSPGIVRSFCGRCGSPLTYRREATPEALDVMTVSLDDPDAMPPTFRVWADEALAWDRQLVAYPGSRGD